MQNKNTICTDLLPPLILNEEPRYVVVLSSLNPQNKDMVLNDLHLAWDINAVKTILYLKNDEFKQDMDKYSPPDMGEFKKWSLLLLDTPLSVKDNHLTMECISALNRTLKERTSPPFLNVFLSHYPSLHHHFSELMSAI